MRHTSLVRSAKALVEANFSHNVYENGVKVFNLPSNAAASRLSITLNAGSRHETADNVGAASITRNCIGLSNYTNTGFLQHKMVNLMGGQFSTHGNRERTVINLSAGPKAIEELAMGVIVPAITEPVFLKWEMTHAWEQARNQRECRLQEAFHSVSFKGALSHNLTYKGEDVDSNPFYFAEREEVLELLVKDFHHNHYGLEGATVVGCGVSDTFLDNFVQALKSNPFGTSTSSPDGFYAGQMRIRESGASVAVVGVDVTSADPAAAKILAASLGGSIVSYSDVSVLQFKANSTDILYAKLDSLNNVNFEAAKATTLLTETLLFNSGDALAVKSVADGHILTDVASASQDQVQELASALSHQAKSLVVVGDTLAFPHNTEI